MIRAHLATFPPRRRLVKPVVQAIVPQVDHLFVVLNDYDTVPGFLARDPRITAIIPDTDLKDAGKFYFAPDPDDIVFTIDDDIGYPPDYVSLTLERANVVGFDGHVFGYQGNAATMGAQGWRNFLFHQPHDTITGITVIGTGTLCARGDAIPPLSEIAPFAGAADYAYGAWLADHAICPWTLPRAENWLPNVLPRQLYKGSLFASVTRTRPPAHVEKLISFMSRQPHAGLRFADVTMRLPSRPRGEEPNGPIHSS